MRFNSATRQVCEGSPRRFNSCRGAQFQKRNRKKTMKIKVWQALIPIVGVFLIQVAVVVGLIWVAIHFIRKFW